MAVPGDAQCHEVAPCGVGDYGTIPVDEKTQYVNAAYPWNDSNGTESQPWKHIQQGIDHAQEGATVAVAAGTYLEDPWIHEGAVKVWGRCPALVEVVGTGKVNRTFSITTSKAVEVHSLAITGPARGILVDGSSELIVDRVWIHNTGSTGIQAQSPLVSPPIISVSSSLIEATTKAGVSLLGARATIEATVIRDTQSGGEETGGMGIVLNSRPEGRGTLALRASLLEQNRAVGVAAYGADATIEATVVRKTQPRGDGLFGTGIQAAGRDTYGRARLLLRTSFIDDNHEAGVAVFGSDATIETTVVRKTQPVGDWWSGAGVQIRDSDITLERANVTLRASLLEDNHSIGVFVAGSDATIEASIVRDTQPLGDGTNGHGFIVQEGAFTRQRGTLTLRASLVERNHHVGVAVFGADATIEATIVRDTQPLSSENSGMGIVVFDNEGSHARSRVTLRSSVVENNRYVGVFVVGSDVTIEATIVRDTQLNGDGQYGRGIVLQERIYGEREALPHDGPYKRQRGALTLRTSLVENNHDVGVFVYGSDATIEATIVRGTQPEGDGHSGDGIVIQPGTIEEEHSMLMLRTSLVENNHDIGVFVDGSDATIEATIVRDTQPEIDGGYGVGIVLQSRTSGEERPSLTLRASVVEKNREVGVAVLNADATIEATLVRETQPNGDGVHGDGILVISTLPSAASKPARATITETRIESNSRAGIANISAAVLLISSAVQCNKVDLDGERDQGQPPFTFDGSKGNVCGCETPDPTCAVLSSKLSPPPPISPVKP